MSAHVRPGSAVLKVPLGEAASDDSGGGIMMRVQRVGHVRPSSGSVSLSESLLLLLMVISSSAGVKAGDPCISLAVRCRAGSKRSKLCVAVQIAYTGGRVHTQSRAKGKSSPGIFTSF